MGQFNNKRHDFFCLMMNLLSIKKKKNTIKAYNPWYALKQDTVPMWTNKHTSWVTFSAICEKSRRHCHGSCVLCLKRVCLCRHVWSEGVCVCLLWWVCFLWCLFTWRRNECVSLEGVVFMACLYLDGTLRFLLCVCVLDLDGYWQHAESWHTAVLSSTHSPVWPFKCILTLCWRCPMRLRMTAHTQIQT